MQRFLPEMTMTTPPAALVPAPSRRREDRLERENETLRNQLRQSDLRLRRALSDAKQHAEEARTSAIAEALTALLPTFDNLQFAVNMRRGEPAFQDGLIITYHELERSLDALGLKVH